MKHAKKLLLAAATAGVLIAAIGTGSASATELTCTEPAGTKVMCPTGTLIHANSEGHAVLDSLAGKIECNGTVEGESNTGGSGITVTVSIRTLAFTGCTVAVVEVKKAGTLEIHTENATANNNGTVTSSGAEVTVETFGVHCIFTTSNTDIGTLTGSTTTGGTPTLDISATIPRTGGRSGAFCGTSAPWTGSYAVNIPMWMDVD